MNELEELFTEYVEDFIPDAPEPPQGPPEAQEIAKNVEKANEKEKSEAEKEREEWAKKAKEKRDEAFRTITAEAEKVFQKRTELIDFLTVQSYFDRYSVKNCLLITAQYPGATRLLPFDAWADEGKHIKKGAKAITLIEPGDEYYRKDGSVGRHYNTRALFDISQVTGGKYDPPKPEISDAEKLKTLFVLSGALSQKLCSYGEDGGRASFYQYDKNAIYINKTADFSFIYPQLCVELAHAVTANGHKNYTRQKYGFICEMAGYITCVRSNVSVLEEAIPLKIPYSYTELAEKDVIKILEEVRGTANTIIQAMQKLAHKE